MKRIVKSLLCIITVLVFVFCMTINSSAADDVDEGGVDQSTENEFKTYVEEKIIPIVTGVATSILAMIATLKSISSTIKELKLKKTEFEDSQVAQTEISKKSFADIIEKYEEIKKSVEGVPELKEQYQQLIEQEQKAYEQIKALVEISTIAFSAMPDLVRAGKAKQIHTLIESLGIQEVTNGENI